MYNAGMQTANHKKGDKQGDVTVDSKVPSEIIKDPTPFIIDITFSQWIWKNHRGHEFGPQKGDSH